MSLKKKVFILLTCLFVAAVVLMQRTLTVKTVIINFQNISSVEVYRSATLQEGEGDTPVATLTSSGQKLKLKKGSYAFRYDAHENYEDLFVEVGVQENGQVVELVPRFSEEYLNSLVDKELPAVTRTLKDKYQKISAYEIRRGKLYKNGDWYGTVLVYKGKEYENSDTLRIVLRKNDGKWEVASDPPNIVLSKLLYPDIPEEILREVNSLTDPIKRP